MSSLSTILRAMPKGAAKRPKKSAVRSQFVHLIPKPAGLRKFAEAAHLPRKKAVKRASREQSGKPARNAVEASWDRAFKAAAGYSLVTVRDARPIEPAAQGSRRQAQPAAPRSAKDIQASWDRAFANAGRRGA